MNTFEDWLAQSRDDQVTDSQKKAWNETLAILGDILEQTYPTGHARP